MQKLKTLLLRNEPVADNAKKAFSRNTRIKNPTAKEIASFQTLQSLLTKPSYLVHADPRRPLYVDLDSSKEFGFAGMVYHVKPSANWDGKGYPPRKSIEPVLFLSRLLIDAETRYWLTELELARIVWVLRKVRHLVESSEADPTVIFTDHNAALDIAKQTSITIASTDKLNLQLIRALNYIQRFNVELRHKPNKQHIVPNALSRLTSTNTGIAPAKSELDALFTTTLVKVEENFRRKLVAGYTSDLN